MVWLFRFVSDTGIIPKAFFAGKVSSNSATGDILNKNINMVTMILIINFIHKMSLKFY